MTDTINYTPSLEQQRISTGCPEGNTATHYEEPMEWRATMDTTVGEYHWRGGMTFKRLSCGCVRLAQWVQDDEKRWFRGGLAFIPSGEWDSIVREVSHG